MLRWCIRSNWLFVQDSLRRVTGSGEGGERWAGLDCVQMIKAYSVSVKGGRFPKMPAGSLEKLEYKPLLCPEELTRFRKRRPPPHWPSCLHQRGRQSLLTLMH